MGNAIEAKTVRIKQSYMLEKLRLTIQGDGNALIEESTNMHIRQIAKPGEGSMKFRETYLRDLIYIHALRLDPEFYPMQLVQILGLAQTQIHF